MKRAGREVARRVQSEQHWLTRIERLDEGDYCEVRHHGEWVPARVNRKTLNSSYWSLDLVDLHGNPLTARSTFRSIAIKTLACSTFENGEMLVNSTCENANWIVHVTVHIEQLRCPGQVDAWPGSYPR